MFYPFPLVAEAESADSSGLFTLSTALQLFVDSTQARLAVLPPVPDDEHVGQVRDIARREAQRLDFGEFPIYWFRGDKRPQRCEGRVDILGPVPLPGVRRVPLTHHDDAVLLPVTLPRSPAAAVALVGAAVALAAIPLLVVRH